MYKIKIKGQLWRSFLIYCLIFFLSSFFSISAQTTAEEVIKKVLKTPENESSKLFVLQFGATGMTEFAAKAFSNMIARNIANTNRFDVIPLQEVEALVQKQSPALLPCFEISCGIQMGKLIESDWILSGHISLTASGLYSLAVKLVHIVDNSLEFEDTIRFTDESMDRRYYQLSNRIANNAPLIGNIVEANNKLAVIDLGKRDGISVGDQMVIYRNRTTSDSMSENPSETVRRQNIGILKITKVGEINSEGVYFQIIETPEPEQYVAAFLNKRKQIKLMDEVRKELDTHLRNVFEIKKSVELTPVQLEDIARRKWVGKVRLLEAHRDFWQLFLISSGIASAYFFSQFQPGDDIKLVASLGVFGYSTFEYFTTKNQIQKMLDEGKFKGYLELKIRPEFNEVKLDYSVSF